MFKHGNTQELISEYYSYQFLKALCQHVNDIGFDPDHLMNPGGTLGLDTPESEKHYTREDIRPNDSSE